MGTRPLPSSRRVPSAAVPYHGARRSGENFEAAERFDLEGIVTKRKQPCLLRFTVPLKRLCFPLDKNLVCASPGSHPAAAWVCACVTGQTWSDLATWPGAPRES
jgi:hypothetical protein